MDNDEESDGTNEHHSRSNGKPSAYGEVLNERKNKRGYSKKRRKFEAKSIPFSIIGSNARGIKAKVDSLLNTIKSFNVPSVITIQETLLKNAESLKIPG